MSKKPQSVSHLYRSSKAMGLISSDPITATTYGGHKYRKNFGLKQPIPNTKTPFIRVKRMDYGDGYPEYDRVGKEALFVKRWDEGGWGVNRYHDQQGELLPQSWWDKESVKKHELQTSPSPNFFDLEALSEEEFEEYLDHIRNLRSEFKQFIQQDDLYQASKNVNIDTLRDFLSLHPYKRSKDETTFLPSMPHPNRALSYAPANQMYNEYLSKPIPGRVLFARNAGGGTGGMRRAGGTGRTQWIAAALGINAVATISGDASVYPTQWYADEEGKRNNDQGKTQFRIESVLTQGKSDPDEADLRLTRWPYEHLIKHYRSSNHGNIPELPFKVSLKTVSLQAEKKRERFGTPKYIAQEEDVVEDPVPSTLRERLTRRSPLMRTSSGKSKFVARENRSMASPGVDGNIESLRATLGRRSLTSTLSNKQQETNSTSSSSEAESSSSATTTTTS